MSHREAQRTPALQPLDEPSGAEGSPELAGSPDHDDRLILWMLRRSPEQRLEALQGFVDGLSTLRHARKITQ